jgi:hypothetical protein
MHGPFKPSLDFLGVRKSFDRVRRISGHYSARPVRGCGVRVRNSQEAVDHESAATADSRFPFTAEDLRVSRVNFAESASVCPGKAALWFQAPQRQESGHIWLDVVQATGQSGLAGGHSYVFECTLGTCRLDADVPLISDYMVGCRVSMISSTTPILVA